MENKEFNILSLFDGISCGQIALNASGVKYGKYYASEIDKLPIRTTQHNYPDTIQLGDCKNWKDWDINFSSIGILMAGFPCQSWSIAGKQGGVSDVRGQLLFTMMDIFNHIRTLNPDVLFLFENVKMKKEFQEYVDDVIGCESIFINSMLVSAQNRNRQYWTNIPNVIVPNDRNVLLHDILDQGVIDGVNVIFESDEHWLYANNGKKIRLSKNIPTPYTIYESRTEFGKQERARLKKELGRDTTPRNKEHKEYLPLKSNKANCLLTSLNALDYILDSDGNYRSFTLNELCRLQNVPLDYFNGLGLTKPQIRKMIGNGWTVDVIAHIFSFIPKNT
jgi:site-specific DNA-cytosine methylase